MQRNSCSLFARILFAAATCAAALRANSVNDAPILSLDGARTVVATAIKQARTLKTTGAIAVVDTGGNILALERVDGTFPASAGIAIGKARTAALFQKPTRVFEDAVNKGRTSMVALSGGAMEGFTPLAGGVPIVASGHVVGAVGVSGAASAAQDEELALGAAKALDMPSAPVSYFESAKVSNAFASGAVLFDRGERYMIHASRREKPGMAEIHDEDADIVHVLDGSATIITGGHATNVKAIADGESRGDSISGGEERKLVKGDVIVIPKGVPHWFREVDAPFLYYVVKVR